MRWQIPAVHPAGGAFLWILILFAMAFADYLTRPAN